jgi:hypothetical protein
MSNEELVGLFGDRLRDRAEIPEDWEPVTVRLKFASEAAIIESMWSRLSLTEALVVVEKRRCQIWRRRQEKDRYPGHCYSGFVRTR